MKIISNGECYIQGKDILYICNYVPMISDDIKLKLNSLFTKIDDYVLVCDSELVEFIKKCEFLISFNYLFNIDYSVLDNMALKLKIELSDMDHEEDSLSSDGDRVEYRERIKNKCKNKEYLLEQIISMMKYKSGKSMCNFPNIPNPCINSIVSDDLIASLSLNYENILIHKTNNSLFENINNPEFGNVSYRLFMHDRFGDNIDKVDVEQTISGDSKYVCVKGINLENIENNNSERRL